MGRWGLLSSEKLKMCSLCLAVGFGIYYIDNGEPVIKGVEPESCLRGSPWWNIWNICERR